MLHLALVMPAMQLIVACSTKDAFKKSWLRSLCEQNSYTYMALIMPTFYFGHNLLGILVLSHCGITFVGKLNMWERGLGEGGGREEMKEIEIFLQFYSFEIQSFSHLLIRMGT